MSISIVTLVSGTEQSVGDGITAPVRCLVRYPDQSLRPAIFKRLEPEGVAAEVFCALLLRGWGLLVPDPAIVLGDSIGFASIDVGYPSLKQKIGWSSTLPPQVRLILEHSGAKLVAGFADTPKAISVDEAIDNRDRNLGNLLWDGSTVTWIDHERCFGRENLPDINKLVGLVLASGLDHSEIQRAAIGIALTLGRQVIKDAEAACGTLSVANFATEVSSRLGPLATKVLQRFPQPQDLLV